MRLLIGFVVVVDTVVVVDIVGIVVVVTVKVFVVEVEDVVNAGLGCLVRTVKATVKPIIVEINRSMKHP
jgi:hypothetical protein